jgi:hypothetical protein
MNGTLREKRRRVNLFSQKSLRGWFARAGGDAIAGLKKSPAVSSGAFFVGGTFQCSMMR